MEGMMSKDNSLIGYHVKQKNIIETTIINE